LFFLALSFPVGAPCPYFPVWVPVVTCPPII
jgi:hypothetical protein